MLACYCDLRFAARGAKLTTSHGRLGLPAEYGLSWLLPRLIGVTRAADLLLSSRVVLAEEAEQLGLVNCALPPDELLPHTYAYAGLLATEVAPSSLAATKLQLYRDLHGDVATSVNEAASRMAEMMGGADFAVGVAASREAPTCVPRPTALSRLSPSAVDAGRELGGVPAEEGHGLAEGEAVGHPGDVGDGRLHRLTAAGDHVRGSRRRGAIGDEVGPVREVLHQGPQHADHGFALAQPTRRGR